MMTPADREKRGVQMENMRLNRMKRDKVKDNILILTQEGVKKYQETGDEKYLEQVDDMRKEMLFASGLNEGDLTDVGPQAYSNYDASGTWTNTPDPYPVIGTGSLMAGSIGGSLKGYKYGQKMWAKKFLKGAAKGARATKRSLVGKSWWRCSWWHGWYRVNGLRV